MEIAFSLRFRFSEILRSDALKSRLFVKVENRPLLEDHFYPSVFQQLTAWYVW